MQLAAEDVDPAELLCEPVFRPAVGSRAPTPTIHGSFGSPDHRGFLGVERLETRGRRLVRFLLAASWSCGELVGLHSRE